MNQNQFDIAILTEHQYVNPTEENDYIRNVLLEDQLLFDALEKQNFSVIKINWDNPDIDWNLIDMVLFRSIWDYHLRFTEFKKWLTSVSTKCICINPLDLVLWNIDKHYLHDLELAGINIVNTQFIKKDDRRTLNEIVNKCQWKNIVLKPTISAAARSTYKILEDQIDQYETAFRSAISIEDMMIQPFIESIETKGELSMMVFGGQYSHTVLKKVKNGDFRVQDDHGGTVHDYVANPEEITFAERVVKACSTMPLYARVDVVWNNNDELALSELEIIEPELWFRKKPESAQELAKHIKTYTLKNI